MFCPLCHAEYRQGFTRCSDCDVPLVNAQPETDLGTPDSRSKDEDALVLLWRGGNPVEYTALVAGLRDAGIPFEESFPRDFENTISSRSADRLYYGIPNFDLRVQSRDLFAGLRVLRSVQKQQLQKSEPEVVGPGLVPAASAVEIVERCAAEKWDRAAATIEVWSGDDETKAQFLMDTFRENCVPCRSVGADEASCPIRIFVRPEDETRACEILREIAEGTPPSWSSRN